jgi:hypothetical protein
LVSTSISKNILLLLISRVAFCCYLAFLYSCECPADIDTPQQNTPNQFAEVNIFNNTNSLKEVKSNNVFIENQSIENDGYSSYFAGNSIITFSENDDPLYSKAISLINNLDYTLVFYEISDRYFLSFVEDNSKVKTRFFNCSSEEILVLIDNQEFFVQANEILELEEIPSSAVLSLENETKNLDFSNFDTNNINNIILENELNTKYFTSF